MFSLNSLIYISSKQIGFFRGFAFYLTNHYSCFSALICIVLLVLLAIIGLVKQSNYMTNFLLWLVVVNLNNYLYSALTTGDYLLNQLLLFNIFFSSKSVTNPIVQDFKTVFHNIALIGIKTQVCLAYFLAGLFKLNDHSWIDGSAVSYIIQIPEYSNSILISLPSSLCLIFTYLTLIYQITFPITVFLMPLKKYVFAFGILQHIIISLVMGLFTFGIIMIICYILFLKYDYSRKTDKFE